MAAGISSGTAEPADCHGADAVPDLADLLATDALLDRLGDRLSFRATAPDDLFGDGSFATAGATAGGTGRSATGAGLGSDESDPLFGALLTWQQDLRLDDVPPLPSLGRADWALRRGRPRSHWKVLAVAAAIVLLLVSTAGVGSRLAKPGDLLWPVTRALWSDRVTSAEAGDKARLALERARAKVSSGDLTGAAVVLTSVPIEIVRVQPRDGRDELDREYSSLASQVPLLPTASGGNAPRVDPGDSDRTDGRGALPAPQIAPGAATTGTAASTRSATRTATTHPAPTSGSRPTSPPAAARTPEHPSTIPSAPATSTGIAPSSPVTSETSAPQTTAEPPTQGSTTEPTPTPTTEPVPTTGESTGTEPPAGTSSSSSSTSTTSSGILQIPVSSSASTTSTASTLAGPLQSAQDADTAAAQGAQQQVVAQNQAALQDSAN